MLRGNRALTLHLP